MESDKLALQKERSALEQEKAGLREELVRVERDKLDGDTEKSGITISVQNKLTTINYCRKDNI